MGDHAHDPVSACVPAPPSADGAQMSTGQVIGEDEWCSPAIPEAARRRIAVAAVSVRLERTFARLPDAPPGGPCPLVARWAHAAGLLERAAIRGDVAAAAELVGAMADLERDVDAAQRPPPCVRCGGTGVSPHSRHPHATACLCVAPPAFTASDFVVVAGGR